MKVSLGLTDEKGGVTHYYITNCAYFTTLIDEEASSKFFNTTKRDEIVRNGDDEIYVNGKKYISTRYFRQKNKSFPKPYISTFCSQLFLRPCERWVSLKPFVISHENNYYIEEEPFIKEFLKLTCSDTGNLINEFIKNICADSLVKEFKKNARAESKE